jgi:hypothetical protein
MPLRYRLAYATLATVLSAPLGAQGLVTTTYGPFSITAATCTQVSGPLYTVNVTTTGTLRVQYNASAGHCSDVRARIQVDGIERGVTALLTAGQSSRFIDVGPESSCAHTVALQGEGRVSGCNTGTLAGWGGTMDVTTSTAAASEPIPGPGLLATFLAFALGAYAFGPWRRRR